MDKNSVHPWFMLAGTVQAVDMLTSCAILNINTICIDSGQGIDITNTAPRVKAGCPLTRLFIRTRTCFKFIPQAFIIICVICF